MEKLDPRTHGRSPDFVAENVEQLRRLFPDIFTEGKVDFDALRQLLGEYADDQIERYGLNWAGKGRARQIAQKPSSGTLRPAPDESVDWDTTQNVFIEGDNLEALKLLQKSYHRRVKMIYIDPPYNTGKEFIYPDKYQDNLDTYLRYTGQVDGDGLKITANAETQGRYHTNWLNMMYPRLRLARNLLRDDGFLFISIDNNELANLRALCDEIMGPENFVAIITRPTGTSTGGGNDEFVSEVDYVVAYRRSETARVQGLPLSEKDSAIYDQRDERGRYLIRSLRRTGGDNRREDRPTMFFSLTAPDGTQVLPYGPISDGRYESRWTCGPEKYAEMLSAGLIEWHQRPSQDGDGLEWKVYQKFYLDGRSKQPSDLWKPVQGNKKATRELRALFDGRKVFDHPKPVTLMARLSMIAGCGGKDIVLDFFAGSGSTAEAVWSRNLESGDAVRFILVQLPEVTEAGSEATKAGFHTLSELCVERLRRSARQLAKHELPFAAPDLGFRVFKLDSTNIKPWDGGLENLEPNLLAAVDNIKHDRSENDVLYELLLKYGLDLSLPIEERTVEGKRVFLLGAGALVVCLASDVTLSVVDGIGALKKELNPEVMRVVFRDASFKDDVVKTNAMQILKRAGIDDIKSL